MPKLIDVHTHIQFEDFNKDRKEVINRALNQNIWLINVGADKKSSQEAVIIAEQYLNGVWATVGTHPHNINEEIDWDFYKNLAQNKKVVAVGECGLDYFGIKNNELEVKNLQKEIFVKQIELAITLKKPLMIHCRGAFNDLISVLNSYFIIHNSRKSIIHFFTGTLENAKKLLEMGFYFTFGGLITFNRSFDEIIKFLPLDKILLETDAPYVAPEPYRSAPLDPAKAGPTRQERNEPLYVIEVAKKLAEIKNFSLEKVAEQTTLNAIDIFKLSG